MPKPKTYLTIPVFKMVYQCVKKDMKQKIKPLTRFISDDEFEKIKEQCREKGICV